MYTQHCIFRELSGKYASRINGGSVVISFGDESLVDLWSTPGNVKDRNFSITQLPNEEGEVFTKAT